jgi:Cft2 family RNA processing exonuclease
MDGRICITSMGGSGENGRNCFALEWEGNVFLLDCGVKREIRDRQVGFYPALTRNFVKKIKAVFLSHCHEDHSASLPLLYEMGYRGKVYASDETITKTPAFLTKWADFAQRNGGVLPFSPGQTGNVQFEPLPLGRSVTVEGIPVITGRSGHVLGGIWFHFNFGDRFGDRKVFYSGDMILNPLLLQCDMPPKSGAAVMNNAHGGQKIEAREQYAKLSDSIQTTLSSGGIVLLPVPPSGRGCDIYHYLSRQLKGINLFVESSILNSYGQLLKKTEWINPEPIDRHIINALVTPVENQRQREDALRNKVAVYLTDDGMISTRDSQYCYERLKGGRKNKIIITGHAAEGTTGAGIFDPAFRAANGVLCEPEKIIFKAHLDDDDAVRLIETISAEHIILFHAPAENHRNLIARLKEKSADARCIRFPDWVTLPSV